MSHTTTPPPIAPLKPLKTGRPTKSYQPAEACEYCGHRYSQQANPLAHGQEVLLHLRESATCRAQRTNEDNAALDEVLDTYFGRTDVPDTPEPWLPPPAHAHTPPPPEDNTAEGRACSPSAPLEAAVLGGTLWADLPTEEQVDPGVRGAIDLLHRCLVSAQEAADRIAWGWGTARAALPPPSPEPPAATEPAGFILYFDYMQRHIHHNACVHGWHEAELHHATAIALIHSEASEALEAARHGNPQSETIPEFTQIEEELADIVIRCMDYAEAHGFELAEAIAAKHHYNQGRPYKHGKEF